METQMQQGRFTSTGVARTLAIRSDVDWIEIWNATTMAAAGAGTGVKFFWQRGMANDTAVEYIKTAVTNALAPAVVATGGVSLTDTTIMTTLAPQTVTSISGAAPGVVATGNTAGLINGDVVRLFSIVGGRQLEAIDFQIGNVINNTSFTLANMPAVVAAPAPGAAALYRKISFDSYWYPRSRYACVITRAANAVVTTTVDHSYTVGQVVRMIVPDAYGMREMNNLQATITAVTASTFTTDIDSTGFTAFTFPLTAAAPFSPAMVVPFGDAAVTPYESILAGATQNVGLIGVTLAAGANSPAGVNTNVIYWRAGKSYIVDNQ
jgi:hypothetical protein